MVPPVELLLEPLLESDTLPSEADPALDAEIVVPGRGPLATRADLLAYRAKIATLISRAGALVKRGVPGEQFLAELKTDDLGWRLRLDPAQVKGLYADLLG